VHENEKSELTFTELLFEIGITATLLIKVKTIANKDPGDPNCNADCGFGNHGHSNTQNPDILQKIHETLVATSAIMEKVAFHHFSHRAH